MSAIFSRASAPNLSAIAERLRAHARLCEHIAQECWNEETAQKLRLMANDCARAAGEIASQPAAAALTRH
ncbi:MAG TPA: hypothetical protein VFB31_07905 [Pseudolabrys sp.]|nr:hypothetical protein [Pseudolabrys sp.]